MTEYKSANFQDAKKVVLDYYDALDNATPETVVDVIRQVTAPDYRWKGMHPYGEIHGASTVATEFWTPFKQSFGKYQRRADIFFAGLNEIDEFESTWVVQMGHLMGLFDAPWLHIPPTGKMTFMRYVEFNRIADGKIVETVSHFDIPMVMTQVGVYPFAPQTGAFFVQPGPITHDGLLFDDAPESLGKTTLDTMHRMLNNVRSGRATKTDSSEGGLGDAWHDDMIWFGPCGIGATHTKARYQLQHRLPGVKSCDYNVKGGASIGHLARLSEGKFGGFYGWPNFRSKFTGGFMTMSNSDAEIDWRVVDIYHVIDGKIAENWVFIDLLYMYHMQNVDILDRMRQTTQSHVYNAWA